MNYYDCSIFSTAESLGYCCFLQFSKAAIAWKSVTESGVTRDSCPQLASAVAGPFWRQDRKILSATGPDLTVRIGVKDRIANSYFRNMFWVSGALSNPDCML